MTLNQGIPTIESYNQLLKSNFFRKMERFSNQFVGQNKFTLEKYSRKWVADPLHQWSRQYEYPFVYTYVRDYISNQRKFNIKILDAGSGVTFFPYYISSIFSNVTVDCCDYDILLEPIFSVINRNSRFPVGYFSADICHLPFNKNSYDIVYCISVLEHTKNFETIIQEFKRILKQKGLLIVTFDISINGLTDSISQEKAKELIETLKRYFYCIEDFNLKQGLEFLNSNKILTTRYIRKFDKNLLPWKRPWFLTFKNILKLRFPKVKNLTCFCQVLVNE